MKSSELKISISAESYDEKTAENDRKFYVVEKHIENCVKIWRLLFFILSEK